MGMLRLRKVGNRHEVSHGDHYVGEIDDAHLRDYVANLPPTGSGRFSSTIVGTGYRPATQTLAAMIAEKKREILELRPNMRPTKAFLTAKDIVLREHPDLASAYHEEAKQRGGREG